MLLAVVFLQEVQIDKQLEEGLRVTVRLDEKQNPGTVRQVLVST